MEYIESELAFDAFITSLNSKYSDEWTLAFNTILNLFETNRKHYFLIKGMPYLQKVACLLMALGEMSMYLLISGPSRMDPSPTKRRAHDILHKSFKDFCVRLEKCVLFDETVNSIYTLDEYMSLNDSCNQYVMDPENSQDYISIVNFAARALWREDVPGDHEGIYLRPQR